jgi:hypothetical protein
MQHALSRVKHNPGEMLEWLKRHAWKACKPPKGFTGSNPVLSAFVKCRWPFRPRHLFFFAGSQELGSFFVGNLEASLLETPRRFGFARLNGSLVCLVFRGVFGRFVDLRRYVLHQGREGQDLLAEMRVQVSLGLLPHF